MDNGNFEYYKAPNKLTFKEHLLIFGTMIVFSITIVTGIILIIKFA